MWELLRIVACSAVSALGQRRDLALENLALRHQLTVLKRQSKKPQLEDRDRLFWIGMKRFWPGWSGALHLVQPATVVGWHRAMVPLLLAPQEQARWSSEDRSGDP